MAINKNIEIKKLKLDLQNYRTVSQASETDATSAMIALKPEYFWALTESILTDGYHATENLIVLKEGRSLCVKEGNRRVAAMKIIFGLLPEDSIQLPSHLQTAIANLDNEWKLKNKAVPCMLYDASEKDAVATIIALTHAKGEKAGRDHWSAVARARYKRDEQGGNEPGLDLLEAYLQQGKNLSKQQAERWGGDYPLTNLNDAIPKVASRCGASSSRELADAYPRVQNRQALEDIIRDIGLKTITHIDIRLKGDKEFGESMYGLPKLEEEKETSDGTSTKSQKKVAKKVVKKATKKKSKGTAASSISDPRTVKAALRNLVPIGKNREKVVTLLNEANALSLKKNPLAFCFILRSMFEISAKAYCSDHQSDPKGPRADKKGRERPLSDVLRDITNHLTHDNSDREKVKKLHGAIAALNQPSGFLSVTSLNQLVHNPKFTVDESHICVLFGNIFPLLEEMNS